MLNVQTLGILLRALRDGNTRPDALRAPAAVAGVARTPPVAADANESERGDAPVRTLPALRSALPAISANEREPSPPSHDAAQPGADKRVAPRDPAAAPMPRPPAPQEPPRSGSASDSNSALALSPTGRWLTAVQNRAPETAPLAASHTSAPPLVNDVAAPAPVLAAALARAVAASGVFYEAHLARWINDDFALASLASEPQSSWASATRADLQPATAPSLPQDADKLSLVARQLDTLETKTIAWSGPAWPGQSASIEIREDESRGRGERAEAEPPATAWRTRIMMTLPSLGPVEARLALRGNVLELSLVAGGGAQSRLAAAREELRLALATRSLELAAFSIGHADER